MFRVLKSVWSDALSLAQYKEEHRKKTREKIENMENRWKKAADEKLKWCFLAHLLRLIAPAASLVSDSSIGSETRQAKGQKREMKYLHNANFVHAANYYLIA